MLTDAILKSSQTKLKLLSLALFVLFLASSIPSCDVLCSTILFKAVDGVKLTLL